MKVVMFQIRKNAPKPPSHRGPGREPIYPFAQMNIGDSFVLVPKPATDTKPAEDPTLVADRVRGAAATWRKRNMSTLSFSVRVFVEDGVTVVGVWADKAKTKAAV
jgi:hypothetical protein